MAAGPSGGRRPPQGRHQRAGADRAVHIHTAALKVRLGGRRSGQLLAELGATRQNSELGPRRVRG